MVFGIGSTELVIIALFAFLVFGPDKIPEVARTVGKGMRWFRKAQNDMQRMVNLEVSKANVKEREERLAATADAKGAEESKADESEDTPTAQQIWDSTGDDDEDEEDEDEE